MAVDPITDGSGGYAPPVVVPSMLWQDYGSSGLRQYSGWVREEYLSDLVGQNGARTYREMLDGSSVIGSMIFAITQAMRKVTWRVEPAGTDGVKKADQIKAGAQKEADFVESLMHDMSHTWEDFVTESLSMLGYGYAPHEIVYKRRLGKRPESTPGPKPRTERASSEYDDGRIGWRRLPLRGQDTVLKWFLDENGQVRGLTQQPWVGALIDIPIQKLLLFRPSSHKGNPEGRSVLRNAYRAWYFTKRLEEQEAVSIERFNGFPVLHVPSQLFDLAAGTGPIAAQAAMSLAAYKKLVTNVRIDEQMGALLPSDVYVSQDGKPTAVRQYEFKLVTPEGAGAGKVEIGKAIDRYKIDCLTTVLADFITMGHEVRGTNNLAVTKVDMFYAAIEAWLNNQAAVFNRYALPRIWRLNGIDDALMPKVVPDLSTRLDLDSLGTFVANINAAGIPLGDIETQTFLREAGGMPAHEAAIKEAQQVFQQAQQQAAAIKAPVSSGKPKKQKVKTDGNN